MYDEDQEIRRILIDSIGGFNSPNAGPFIKKMLDIDKTNQEQLKTILNSYGWIEQSKIGTKAADAIFYIIQHSDIELMENYFPELKRLAGIGEANPRLSAMMEDRLLMWKGKRQIYGTQASDFRLDKQMAIWPIENSENVNERRRQIGFKTTVEEYANSMGVIFDSSDKLPNEMDD
jgi:hypothetical protein